MVGQLNEKLINNYMFYNYLPSEDVIPAFCFEWWAGWQLCCVWVLLCLGVLGQKAAPVQRQTGAPAQPCSHLAHPNTQVLTNCYSFQMGRFRCQLQAIS